MAWVWASGPRELGSGLLWGLELASAQVPAAGPADCTRSPPTQPRRQRILVWRGHKPVYPGDASCVNHKRGMDVLWDVEHAIVG